MIFIPAVLLMACNAKEEMSRPEYPASHKSGQVDNYFGLDVADPYRWLENDTSSETKAWVNAQNKVTFTYLEQIPFRSRIRKRLDELVNYRRQGLPVRAGGYYFFTANSGLQNQDVIYRSEGIDGKSEVFIDPNFFAEDGTVTFSIAGISEDEKYITMAMSEGGSDWRKLITYNVASGQSTGDTLKWVKFSGAAWSGNGFYYSRYPEPVKGADYSASNQFHTVYYHLSGTAQDVDEMIYRDEANPGRYHWSDVTEDGKYLLLYVAEGTDGFECHFRKAADRKSPFRPLFTGFGNKSTVIDHINDRFLVRTDIGAPNYRLVSIDPGKSRSENWIDVLPEGKHLLQGVSSAGGKLFPVYLENAQSKAYCAETDGSGLTAIQLPATGTVYGFGGKAKDSVLFYSFSSFTFPGSVYEYHIGSRQSSVHFRPEISFKSEEYVSEQVFYTSKDGTKISMFLVYRKGLKRDGGNPCLLYGYGGFNISLTPVFSASRIPWLENGGVFAMPNLRGGGEYGEEWHKAGMLDKKQNVFDDFAAAAEYLINEKFTSPAKLVASGRSNGGLLVGALLTQRPDLLKVAIPGVGVLDMLRYHQFTVGHGWIPEYGSSDDEDGFRNLRSYSPLHNLKSGTEYPATFLHTADHDDRVVPAHSYKFAATMQDLYKGANPVLIRIETRAGHGGGKPISKALDEEADILTFSFFNIGHSVYGGN